jgi:hypothetical protein
MAEESITLALRRKLPLRRWTEHGQEPAGSLKIGVFVTVPGPYPADVQHDKKRHFSTHEALLAGAKEPCPSFEAEPGENGPDYFHCATFDEAGEPLDTCRGDLARCPFKREKESTA